MLQNSFFYNLLDSKYQKVYFFKLVKGLLGTPKNWTCGWGLSGYKHFLRIWRLLWYILIKKFLFKDFNFFFFEKNFEKFWKNKFDGSKIITYNLEYMDHVYLFSVEVQCVSKCQSSVWYNFLIKLNSPTQNLGTWLLVQWKKLAIFVTEPKIKRICHSYKNHFKKTWLTFGNIP